MFDTCPASSTAWLVCSINFPKLYMRTEQMDPELTTHHSLLSCHSLGHFVVLLLDFSIPATVCIAVRERRPPRPHPLRSCTERGLIKFLGEYLGMASRFRSRASVLIVRLFPLLWRTSTLALTPWPATTMLWWGPCRTTRMCYSSLCLHKYLAHMQIC